MTDTTRTGIEWPTYAILALCCFGWGAACLLHGNLGLWFVPVAGYFVTLHSSLQHEALHGHPAPGLFIPYRVFRRSHLKHHRDASLTAPYDDPESDYMARRDRDALRAKEGVVHPFLRRG